ncbi:hypothetical protein [Mucilaginibacter sp. PAMB04168]|uniref:hypothetical protein n=1 Tax=Mucilaginibacter sp. PAMB04168 TaxID=3138567 RepID=UPI0031F6F2C5
MNKFYLFLTAFVALMLQAKAQSKPQAPPTSTFNNNWSLQVVAGTQGVGADVRHGVTKNLSVRAGAAFIPVKANNVFSFSGFQSTNNVSVKFSNIHLLADFVPFKNARGFRLVGGAGYLYKATGGIEVLPTGNYKVGNYNLSSADLGTLNIDMSWRGIAPYAGIGLFKSFPQRLFNINLDLGTYYLSKPQSKITGTEMLADNYKLEPQFDSNFKSYRWLPVVQLNFNFKIR